MPIGLHLLRRGRTYFFRCRLPADIAAQVRRQEVVRTLRTRDPAVARLRAAIVAIRLTELWALARMADTAELIDKLLDEWFSAAVDRAFPPLGNGTFAIDVLPHAASMDELHDLNHRLFREDAENRLDALIDDWKRGDFGVGRPIASEIAAKLPEKISERTFAIICKAVMEALGQLEEARIRWADGDVEFMPSRRPAPPPQPAPAGPSAPSADDDDGLTLSESISLHLDLVKRDRKPTEKQLRQTESELRLMAGVLGEAMETRAVTRKQAGQIFEGLRFLPQNFRKHPALAGLAFSEMVAKARELDLAPMHPSTVGGYLNTMRGLFRAELDAGRITTNPFDGMTVKAPRKTESDRGFSLPELGRMLSSPLFIGAKSIARPHDPGDILINDWHFWLVLVAMLTGSRVSEVAQLRPQDVREVDGTWVIDISADGGRRVKTRNSIRRVPVHSELKRLGLLTLAERQRDRGHVRLLPEAPKAVGGEAGKQASQWLREDFLPRLGLKRKGNGSHDFRHGLRTMLRSANVNERVADRITGHATPGIGAAYGKADLSALAAGLESITLPSELAAVPARRFDDAAP